MKKALRVSGICLALWSLTAVNAVADCRSDLEKYRIDSVLYENCSREALKNKDDELLYLVGLWNYTGIRDPFFYKPASIEGYKKFMSLAANLRNPDAQSMYIISEMNNTPKDPKVAEYRAALEKQKDHQSRMRLIQVKQIEGSFGNAELDELQKLAQEPKNYDAAFYYAQILVSFSDQRHAESLKEPIAIFEKLLQIPDTEKNADSIKGQVRWQLYRIYKGMKRAEDSSKAEKYLSELAHGGDVFAMQEYAKAYETSQFGVLDTSYAYAWDKMAFECSKDTLSEESLTDKLKAKTAKLKPAEISAGNARLEELRKSVTCMRSTLIVRNIKDGKVVSDDTTTAPKK